VEKMKSEKTARLVIEMTINFALIDLNKNDFIIVYRKYARKNAMTSLDESRKRNTRKKIIKKRSAYLVKTIVLLVSASNKCKREMKTSIEN